MSEAVIDVFEAVEIDEMQCRNLGAGNLAESFVQTRGNDCTIGEPSEGIMRSLPSKPLLLNKLSLSGSLYRKQIFSPAVQALIAPSLR